jgi:type II secretory pathway pseudopilin PulG
MILAKNEKNQFGFLLVEIMLALAVAVCAIAAAGLMAFAGQTMSVDSELDAQALEMAQRLIEEQRILAGDDFRRVNSTSTAEGIFSGRVNVSRHDFFVKSISAAVNWNINGRNRQTEISALIADYGNTAGNDTCDSNLTGDWKNPQIVKVIDFSDFAENASSTYAIGDIDVYKNKLYVAMEKTGTKKDSTLFVFDISNPSMPILLDKIDNNNAAMAGINAITVNKNYAYAASTGVKQFQIIGINAGPLKIIPTDKISGGGDGQSIFYKDGYIYLGLASKNNVPEFHIIDVRNLSSVVEVGHWPLDGGLRHNINDIYVKGNYAYLAHPTDADGSGGCPQEQLTVLNISNPANPYRVGGFYDYGALGNGKISYLIGDVIYFGRTSSNTSGLSDAIPEFYILDNSMPENLQNKNSVLPRPYAKEISSSANGLIVRDYLAFLLTTKQSEKPGEFQIIRIDLPENISSYANAITLPDSGEENALKTGSGAAMDCEGNYLYVASIDGAGKSYISIITAP